MASPTPAAGNDQAAVQAQPAGPQRSPMLSLAVALLAVTVLGIGVGGAFGLLLLPNAEKVAPLGKAEPASAPAVKGRFGANATLRALAPIITNLASPEKTWVRIEASLVMDGEPADAGVLSAQITDDLIAFLRTVPLAQIEGASGFQHLREDLNDRVRVRSGGKVRDLVIQTFIVE
jgi:flagellar protein FliL